MPLQTELAVVSRSKEPSAARGMFGPAWIRTTLNDPAREQSEACSIGFLSVPALYTQSPTFTVYGNTAGVVGVDTAVVVVVAVVGPSPPGGCCVDISPPGSGSHPYCALTLVVRRHNATGTARSRQHPW